MREGLYIHRIDRQPPPTIVVGALADDRPSAELEAPPPSPPAEPVAAAQYAGLTYASTEAPGVTRRRAGAGFSYRGSDGRRIQDRETLQRIRRLVIPPAWRNVWICPDAKGHIQAIGYDDKGRRQYIYHPRFREVREEAKYHHLIAFAERLPALRARVTADMAQSDLSRLQVLATIVSLLEQTMIRVGNRAYARANQSYGLTTLESRHVRIVGTTLRFAFKGKSGKEWRLDIRDRRIVRIVKTCQELPGQSLFQYIDELGEPQAVSSADVNDYLRQAAGREVSAKDFRTWNGTVMAAAMLAEVGPEVQSATARKKALTAVVRAVSTRLGNTPTICRKCYIHPAVIEAFLDGSLRLDAEGGKAVAGLGAQEQAVLDFLRAREAAAVAAA